MSRKHGAIKFSNKEFYLQDLNSKFGTLVLLRDQTDLTLQDKPFAVQVGRSLIEFKMKTTTKKIKPVKYTPFFLRSSPLVLRKNVIVPVNGATNPADTSKCGLNASQNLHNSSMFPLQNNMSHDQSMMLQPNSLPRDQQPRSDNPMSFPGNISQLVRSSSREYPEETKRENECYSDREALPSERDEKTKGFQRGSTSANNEFRSSYIATMRSQNLEGSQLFVHREKEKLSSSVQLLKVGNQNQHQKQFRDDMQLDRRRDQGPSEMDDTKKRTDLDQLIKEMQAHVE